MECHRRVLSIGRPGVPGLSRCAEKIIARRDVGYLIHAAVVGDDRLPLLCGTNPITLSILIEANLRSADRLAGFIVYRPIEDRLGHEMKKQVFGYSFRTYGNGGGEVFVLLVRLCKIAALGSA